MRDEGENLKFWEQYFALRTTGELKKFCDGLDRSDPDQAAFMRYAKTWRAQHDQDDGRDFDPRAHVSEDLSAALYLGAPCIFLGTNSWAVAASMDAEYHRDRLAHMAKRIGSIREHNPNSTIVLAVIPEKDFVISRMFVRDGSTDSCRTALHGFRRRLSEYGIEMIFDDYLDNMQAYQSLQDYLYPDSHLPTANYIQVASQYFRRSKIEWPRVQERLSIELGDEYCDLNEKLSNSAKNPVRFPMVRMSPAEVHLIEGSESFSEPLGDTRQVLRNDKAVDERRVLILGDSHSSIFAKRKLTYLCAGIFAETEFQWNPCGFRSTIESVPQPVIYMEVAQRFLIAR